MATATGAELWIGTVGPTIADSGGVPTNAELTTWKGLSTTSQVNRVGTIGELGDSVEAVTITDLADGRTRRVPGALDGGEIAVSITETDYDTTTGAGQNLVRLHSNTATNFYIFIQDPTLEDRGKLFQGLVANYMESERSPSVNQGATFTIYRNEAVLDFEIS